MTRSAKKQSQQQPDKSIVMRDELTSVPAKQRDNSINGLAIDQSAKHPLLLPEANNQRRSVIAAHLIKLTMFLVTLTCTHQTSRVNCQKYHHPQPQPQHRLFHHLDTHNPSPQTLNERHPIFMTVNQQQQQQQRNQLLNQLMRSSQESSNSYLSHLNHHHRVYRHQQEAERRASGGQVHPANVVQNENGKLLVCYYTTRDQSPPYWPNDASGYVIPSEHLDSAPQQQQQQQAEVSQQPPAMELRQESGFAPILSSYDRFVGLQQKNGFVAQQRTNSQQQNNIDPQGYGHSKNQQQQLVFKSSISVQQPLLMSGQHYHMMPNVAGSSSVAGDGSSATSKTAPAFAFLSSVPVAGNNNGLKSSNKQHYQDAVSQMFAASEQQQQQVAQNNQPLSGASNSNNNNNNILLAQQQHTLVIAGGGPGNVAIATASGVPKNNNNNKHQTMPFYSLVGNGDLDTISSGQSGGLIVGSVPHSLVNAGGGASFAAASLGGHSANRNNGDNGGFIINNNNNGNHLERNSPAMATKQAPAAVSAQQQQQQLVFPSPSLSRAFIVGSASSNNEVLDTKSQLFIPASHPHSSNTGHRHLQQQTSNGASGGHEQSAQFAAAVQERQKGKSLQLLASGSEQQLSPALQHQQQQQQQAGFSGPVSSTHPVPLSPGSTSPGSQLSATTQQHMTTSATTYRSPQPQSFSSSAANTNQLIVGNGQSSSATGSSQKSSSLYGGSKLPCQSATSTDCLGATKPASASSSSRAGSATGAPETIAPSLHGANGVGDGSSLQQQSISSSSSSSAQQNQHQQHLPTSQSSSAGGSNAASLSSALVSSPLSTMFDVFGAASQYLMRFKPSSLISPSSFVFNTIQSDGHLGLKTNSSTLISSLATGPTGSLLPLSYASAASIVSQQAKASATSPSPSSLSAVSSPSGAAAAAGDVIVGKTSGGDSVSPWSRLSLQNSQQRREDVCGRTIQTPQRRIIGGEGARYGEFPYQVHIKIAKHQCGGALVDRQSIVTAAHCVYHFITRAPVNKLQIVIGAYDIEDEQYQELPPQYFKVNKVKLHPNFRFSASHPDRYDIAILKLDKPVKYTDNVLPVCLPSKDIKYESLVGTVTGFGKTDPSLSNRYGTRLLQKVDVPIIENNECERWHRTRGIDLKIFPEMMCAGYEDGLKDACVGDSGGPLVVKSAVGPNGSFRWTLAGITSAGFGCAQSRQPGIYHRVSHTVDWILENLD